MKKNALISVSDKRGVESLAKGLEAAGYNIYATGRTYEFLKANNIKVRKIEELTGFPEILGGRVKTLHPSIFGGILAKREEEHLNQLRSLNIETFDIVVVNLYPFEDARRKGLKEEELIEFIDIGGPSLIRAAAKNYRWVTVVVSPDDYLEVLEEIQQNGETSLELRKKLALKAFALTAFYDTMIAGYLAKELRENFPEYLSIAGRKIMKLRYGENPHQKAAFYIAPFSVWEEMEVLHGKSLSYNNIADLYSAWNLALEFQEPFVAIIKHQSPCGAAVGADLKEAFEKALASDPQSAFGGIVALNRPVDPATAEAMSKIFLEVIVAPDYQEEALKILQKKKNLRLVRMPFESRTPVEAHFLNGALLVQESDRITGEDFNFRWVTSKTSNRLDEMRFGVKVVKALKSNAAVVIRNGMIVGGCGGQTSRVEAVRIACERAGERAKGAVLVSDGFFPFPDSIEIAASWGIEVVVQPGGSKRDSEVIQKAEELGLAMAFTGRRHFRH